MENTAELIQAKSEAITGLAEALTRAIDTNEVKDISHVKSYLKAWTAAVSAMVPAATTATTSKTGFAGMVYGDGDVIPASVKAFRDRHGSAWTRRDDGWQTTDMPPSSSYSTSHVLEMWGPVTVIA